ncbi:MAG: CvpA family protein [Ruminococcaceae bacterium]|nr:CvpA family protein [Oscillospiraceae bacterium]
MNILLDAFIVLIVVACCTMGYRLGIVKMTVSFLKNIIAIAVASVYSSKFGAFLYRKVFKNVFENMTLEKITDWLGIEKNPNPDIGPLIEAEHSEFFEFIEKIGFDSEVIIEKYNEIGASAGDAMVEFISRPIGHTISCAIAFILIFISTSLLVRLIGFIIGKIVKLPVLNVTNRFLGFILGLVLGVIFVFLFIALVSAIAPYIKINGEYLTVGALEEGTIIYKYLANETPAGLISNILEKIGVL